MAISTREVDGKITITLPERFDFTIQAEFRDCYEKLPINKASKIIINFDHVKSIDSAALGMLLLFHDFLGADFNKSNNNKVQLKGCNNDVKSILKIANFDDVFTLN